MKKTTSIAITVVSILASPAISDVKITERQASFAECRAMLQVFAGALSGKLVEYSKDTSTILESSFENTDGSTKYTITCLADEQKMVFREEPV